MVRDHCKGGQWSAARAGILLLAGLLVSMEAGAQTVPDAGSVLRDIEQTVEPRLAPTRPPIYLPGAETPPDAAFRVLVRDFRIARATLFPESELKALLADLIGRELSFADIQRAAARIGEFYRLRGLLARALIPRQTVQDGIVDIIVLEGRLGAVEIQGAPDARLDPELARNILLRNQSVGEPLRIESAERAILLLNDLPGVKAQAVLVPGKTEGETTMVLKLADGPLASGSIMLDNYGVRSTGTWRAIASLALDNPSGGGDQISLLGLAGEHNAYVRGAYTVRAGLDGLRLGVSASELRYKLGGAFSSLDSEGGATTAGLNAIYPLRRGVERNVYVAIGYEWKRLVNDVAEVNAGDRRVQVGSVTFSGDRIDGYFGGGLSQFSLSAGVGQLGIRNRGDAAVDAAGPRAAGRFAKLAWGVSRLQKLTEKSGLYLALAGQFASKNLDSSEKLSLGGPHGVRAYPITEASGDEGWLFNAELRHSVSDMVQLLAFLDHGEIRINETPWEGWNAGNPGKPARYALSGAGVGVAIAKARDFQLRGIVAAPIGGNPGRDASGNDSDGRRDDIRLWLQLVKFF